MDPHCSALIQLGTNPQLRTKISTLHSVHRIESCDCGVAWQLAATIVFLILSFSFCPLRYCGTCFVTVIFVKESFRPKQEQNLGFKEFQEFFLCFEPMEFNFFFSRLPFFGTELNFQFVSFFFLLNFFSHDGNFPLILFGIKPPHE